MVDLDGLFEEVVRKSAELKDLEREVFELKREYVVSLLSRYGEVNEISDLTDEVPIFRVSVYGNLLDVVVYMRGDKVLVRIVRGNELFDPLLEGKMLFDGVTNDGRFIYKTVISFEELPEFFELVDELLS